MEYYLCRAMEACRLTEDQLYRLHQHEMKDRLIKEIDPITGETKRFEPRMRRCLNPWEIQECLSLPTLKEAYGIPHNELAQDLHNQRLRKMFRELKLIPISEDGQAIDFSIIDVEGIHKFDELCRSNTHLDLKFRGAGEGKGRIVDQIDHKKKQSGDDDPPF